MTRSFLANRKDANQAEITNALCNAQCQVYDMSAVGRGFPDLLVVTKTRRIVLMEVKAIGGKLTPAEKDWIAGFRGPITIARTVEDALDYVEMEEE